MILCIAFSVEIYPFLYKCDLLKTVLKHFNVVFKGDTEEMTVTMNFDPELEGYGSEAGVLKKTRSTESVQSVGSQSSLPPPLPNMGPPSVRR